MTKASRITTIAVVAALTLAISPLLVRAEGIRLIAKIPFSFYVDTREFPAGEYTVERSGHDLSVVRISDGVNHAKVVIAIPASQRMDEASRLVFNKYGDEYFLSKVHWMGSGTAVQLQPSKRELELARKSTPQQIATTGRRS